jgi:hypothetical protein
MTIGWPPPRSSDDVNDIGDLLDFELELSEQQFTFEISRYDSNRWQIHVRKMPACVNKRRSLDDDKLNLVSTGRGKAIWIAKDHMPRSKDAARSLAKLWARNILVYFADGVRFWLPRDNDL